MRPPGPSARATSLASSGRGSYRARMHAAQNPSHDRPPAAAEARAAYLAMVERITASGARDTTAEP